MTLVESYITHETRKRRRHDSTMSEQELMRQKTQPPQLQHHSISMQAPDFNCAAYFQRQIHRIQLSNCLVQHKAVVLFFYQCDFTPSACKDLLSINRQVERFRLLSTMPLAMSTDTEMVHSAFQTTLDFEPQFPLLADTTGSVSKYFQVMNERGLTQRAAFIIDRTRHVVFSFFLSDDRLNHSMDTICSILETL